MPVPIWRAVAPARSISTASCQVEMPPRPTMGIHLLGSLPHHPQSDGQQSRTGNTASVVPNDWPASAISMRMPVRVLIMEMASAPALSAATAISEISVTLGDSFTIRGFCSACALEVMPYTPSVVVPTGRRPASRWGRRYSAPPCPRRYRSAFPRWHSSLQGRFPPH